MFSTLHAYIVATFSPTLSHVIDLITVLLSDFGASRETATMLLAALVVLLSVVVVSLVLDISDDTARRSHAHDMNLIFSIRFAILGLINTAAVAGFLIGWSKGYGPGDTRMAIAYFRDIEYLAMALLPLFTMQAMAVAGAFGLLLSVWQWVLSWFAILLFVPCLIIALSRPARAQRSWLAMASLPQGRAAGRSTVAIGPHTRDRRW